MNAVVDTPIWSLALRRSAGGPSPEAFELAELIREGRAALIGPVRQELLSGVRTFKAFESLRRRLRAFSDLELTTDDFELAAHFFNRCRASGIQGSNTDFLICAVAANHQHSIFSNDRDFGSFAKHIPIVLHQPRT
jgi:predicted nucleic acid-binding protein